MSNYPKSIQNLIDLFSKFPTIGPRTAARFVFYLLKLPKEEFNILIASISQLRESIKICRFCFKTFEEKGDLCEICLNPDRDKTLLCVIEKETDLIPLEKIKRYKGLYFILGGTVSKLRREDMRELRTNELLERVNNPSVFGIQDSNFKEIIIATNPTTEGEATALYLERLLKPLEKKITRLGRGLPVGGELEYADEETIRSALDGRK